MPDCYSVEIVSDLSYDVGYMLLQVEWVPNLTLYVINKRKHYIDTFIRKYSGFTLHIKLTPCGFVMEYDDLS